MLVSVSVVSLLLSRNPLLWPAISRNRTYGTNNERTVSILGKILLVEPIQSIQTALWEVGRVRHNKEKHTRLARERGTQKTHEKERHKTCHTKKHMKKKDTRPVREKGIQEYMKKTDTKHAREMGKHNHKD